MDSSEISRATNVSHILAEALRAAKKYSVNGVVRSSKLERGVRERLEKASFLTEVMRGWYLLTNPAGAGTTTLWFSNYWEFCAQYLQDRLGTEWCISPEQSLMLHAGNTTVPTQLIVI